MKNLIISEHFYSLQGEGKFTGVPSIFLRLTGCNLKCGFRENNRKSSWICDTREVWIKGIKYNTNDLIELFKENDYISKLNKGNVHLIITGGEPLLQQNELYIFLKELTKLVNKNFIIEIETNGTIDVNIQEIEKNDLNIDNFHFNISPKLSNSGEELQRRELKININKEKSYFPYIFKFVLSKKDVVKKEIFEIIDKYNIPKDRIYIMPSGETRKEIENNLIYASLICKEYNFNLSTRLHLHIWDKATGV